MRLETLDIVVQTKKADEKKESRSEIKKKEDSKVVVKLDIDSLETLFQQPENKKKGKKKGGGGNDTDKEDKKAKKKIVSLLADHDQKKHYNVSIGLSRLKKSNLVIHDAIMGMDENELKLDTLLKLQKYVPEEAEQELYRNWDGDSNDLDIPDQFFYALKDIPFLQERLSLWIFKIQFPELYEDNNLKVSILQKAHDIVKFTSLT
ncbi:hypothetical protein RFI_15192 [Reticulomyxa filosa]|uniref:FH2 domain-containing protein n=1 Tax=Reticulomyxa filosa TaxID=46433 RepID=X6N7W5_RETFI|nr:hypothetical protein RFI_15192 [Reticulomyxa filosa]|eukprot:ETO22008.1 hypothetical protein RFI_15192 [Reticulomyxa filosa]